MSPPMGEGQRRLPDLRVTRPSIDTRTLDDLHAVIDSGWLTGGPQVVAFEEALASWLGVAHVVAVSSGTAALHLALIASGVGPGDDVLVPDFTFPATANAVVHSGARPVLVDVDVASMNLDLDAAASAITPATRVILPVHQFGCPMRLGELETFAARHRIALVEDAACALGAGHGGRWCGTVGRISCLSFHPRKVITTGEGGACLTSDAKLAARCRRLRSHGMDPSGARDYREAGFNYRMSELHATLGLGQMARLDAFLESRRGLAGAYARLLAGVDGLQLPATPAEGRHAFQSFVVVLPDNSDRERCMAELRAAGIEAVVPARAIHTLPFFQERYGYRDGDLPRSFRLSRRALGLPLFPAMSLDDVTRVAGSLRAALRA